MPCEKKSSDVEKVTHTAKKRFLRININIKQKQFINKKFDNIKKLLFFKLFNTKTDICYVKQQKY